MSEWGYLTLFRTEDLESLERAVSDLCLAEGLVAVPYVPRKRVRWDKMQYGTGTNSDQWAIAIGAGRGGWSVAKTAPFELLAEPGLSGEHRLGTIARALHCEALHVSLYSSTPMVILEAAPTGEVVLSGFDLEGMTFYGVAIDPERFLPRIECGHVPLSVRAEITRSHCKGYFKLLDELAGRKWDDVSLTLVEGGEVPFASVLSFMRPPSAQSQLGPLYKEPEG